MLITMTNIPPWWPSEGASYMKWAWPRLLTYQTILPLPLASVARWHTFTLNNQCTSIPGNLIGVFYIFGCLVCKRAYLLTFWNAWVPEWHECWLKITKLAAMCLLKWEIFERHFLSTYLHSIKRKTFHLWLK